MASKGVVTRRKNGRAYLYEDMRAMRVGDILTVKIVEKHKGSKSADTAAQRDSTLSNSLAGTGVGYIGIPGIRLGDEARRGLGVDASASNKFSGKGATNREGTLTGTISVIVVEVLPNGDLRVEGRREVTVNSEKQLMTIAGIVRRVDVDTKNTVLSSAIADAKIETALAEITYIPQNTIRLDEKPAEQMLKLMEVLDEHDDVQKVHANFDISDEVMEKVAAAAAG